VATRNLTTTSTSDGGEAAQFGRVTTSSGDGGMSFNSEVLQARRCFVQFSNQIVYHLVLIDFSSGLFSFSCLGQNPCGPCCPTHGGKEPVPCSSLSPCRSAALTSSSPPHLVPRLRPVLCHAPAVHCLPVGVPSYVGTQVKV
jgi:hypothetical protein